MAVTLLNPALLAALLVAVLVAWLAWRWPFPTLAVFLLMLLIHEAVLRILRGPMGLPFEVVTIVSRMRMVALVAMLLAFLARQAQTAWRTRRIPRPGAVDVLMAVVILIACTATLLSPNRLAAIAALRNYFQPVAIFYLARGIHPTQEQLRRLLVVWVALGVIIAAFGVYQWFAWGDAEYARNGYLLAGGELDTAYLRIEGQAPRVRPPSTLTGPNEFGLQMAFLLLATVPWAARLRGRVRWLLWAVSAVFLIGLSYSYSRSALLGALAGLACIALFALLGEGARSIRRRLTTRRILAIGAVVVLLIVGVLAASGMIGRVTRTLRRLPQEYHVRDTLLALDYLSTNPLGPGMGLVGPREGEFFPKVKEYHVEGTLFQIAMDMSVFGTLAWLALWGVALARAWRAWRAVRSPLLHLVDGLAVGAWAASLLTFLILPLMQSFSLMGWLWFLLGLAITSDDVQRQWDADVPPAPVLAA
jgi:O-antigen ligase